MDIREYMQILERYKWAVVFTTIVTAIVVALGSRLMTPVYSASTIVRISDKQSELDYFNLSYTERLINTYIHVLRSRPLLEEIIQRLDLDMLPTNLVKRIEVKALANTELIQITAESSSPEQATEIANMLATLLMEQRQEVLFGQGKSPKEILREQLALVEDSLRNDRAQLEKLLSDQTARAGAIQNLNSRIQVQEQTYALLLSEYDRALTAEAIRANSVSVVEPASMPIAPSRPRMKLYVALGALVGLVGGVGLAFLFDNLDPTIHSADDLEAVADVPLMGSIPGFSIPKGVGDQTVLLSPTGSPSPAGEAFRILRSNILSLDPGTRPKTLLVASAEPGAGKSTVVANLATAIAQAGRRVVVVDADLRRPSLHRVWNLPNEAGLSNVILGLTKLEETIRETQIPGAWVLTSGLLPMKPAELLYSSKMQKLIRDLTDSADIVLLDSPPMLAVADATVLAPMVDGVLLVAARDQATWRRVRTTLQQLDKVGATTLGLILNRARADHGDYFYLSDGTASSKSLTLSSFSLG